MTMNDTRLHHQQGRVIVVVFDMCSSSHIIEELTGSSDVERFTEFITSLKRHLADAKKKVPLEPYKFTGDGWILLFPEGTDGDALLTLIHDLCVFFQKEFEKQVLRYLATPPRLTGLTFGIDQGVLTNMTIYGQPEYVGRAINVACRLQDSIKANDKHPAYKAIASPEVYQRYLRGARKRFQTWKIKRSLRNIRHESDYHCFKIEFFNRK